MSQKIIAKKILIAIILSLIFLTLWNLLVIKPIAEKQRKNKDAIAEVENLEKGRHNYNDKDIKEEIIPIENANILGDISTRGLTLDNIYLKKYKKELNSTDFVRLLSKDYFINFGWLGMNIRTPNRDTIWKAEGHELAKDKPLTLTYDNQEGLIFKVTLSIDDKYMFFVKQSVTNNATENLYIRPFAQIQKKTNNKRDDLNNLQIMGILDNKFHQIKSKRLKSKNMEFDSVKWFTLGEKYWATAIINRNTFETKANLLKVNELYKAQYIASSDLVIKPGQTYETQIDIFTGAKELKLLDNYENTLNIPSFDRIVDFGMFYIISRPLYVILMFFNKFLKNFGLSILTLTVIVKLLLYPSTKKSFLAMDKIKKIQPKIAALQNQYKNDKILLNQKLMKLYKDNNINPISSILPMFMQLPVFIALYKVFSVAIGMRHSAFLGYIKDLSAPDTTNILNLFGLIPLKMNLRIGILPFLTALTMMLQQKLNENADPDKNYNANTKYMPLIFLIVFSGLPSGLLLYWVFSNIITIIQQILINKQK